MTLRNVQLKKYSTIIAILIFLFGAGLIAYPYASDYLYKQSQHAVAATQQETVSKTDTSALDAERQKAIDYNNRLLAGRTVVTDPFDPDQQRVTDQEYESLLNLNNDRVMGQIVIPKIDLDIPIYHGTDDEELQKGVGHMRGTSLPVGGPSTHAVLAGHNGLPSVKIFDNISKLQKGDWFIIQVLGKDLAYRVTGTETVLPDQTESLAIDEGKDEVTLVTCVPYGINTHRLLVHAERCNVPDEWLSRDKVPIVPETSVADTPLLPLTLVGVAIALGLLGARALAKRRSRGKVAVGAGAPAAAVSGVGAEGGVHNASAGVQPPRPIAPARGMAAQPSNPYQRGSNRGRTTNRKSSDAQSHQGSAAKGGVSGAHARGAHAAGPGASTRSRYGKRSLGGGSDKGGAHFGKRQDRW